MKVARFLLFLAALTPLAAGEQLLRRDRADADHLAAMGMHAMAARSANHSMGFIVAVTLAVMFFFVGACYLWVLAASAENAQARAKSKSTKEGLGAAVVVDVERGGLSIEHRFDAAVIRVTDKMAAQGSKMSSDKDSLALYGLYKQAQSGDVEGKRPWSYKRRSCAKWDAWNAVKGMSRVDAMTKYVEIAARLWDPGEPAPVSEFAEVESLRIEFEDAAKSIENAGHAGKVHLSNDSLLKLYALFKQAKEGNVKGSQPSAWNVKRRAMWDAWAGAAGLSKQVAMRKYADTVNELLVAA